MLFADTKFVILPNDEESHNKFIANLLTENGGIVVKHGIELDKYTIVLINNSFVDKNLELIHVDLFLRELKFWNLCDWSYILNEDLKCFKIDNVVKWLNGNLKFADENYEVKVKRKIIDLTKDQESSEGETEADTPDAVDSEEPEFNKNAILVKAFDALAKSYYFKGDQFRARSYKLASGSIGSCGFVIKSGDHAYRNLPNVGSSIAKKIQVLLDKGTLPGLITSSEEDEIVEYFLECYQIGIETAKKWSLLKIKSFSEALSKFPTYFKTEWPLLFGWSYYEDWQLKITRAECEQHFKKVSDALQLIDDKCCVEFQGSYRRGDILCGDIDLMFYKPDCDSIDELSQIIETLAINLYENGYVKCFLQMSPAIHKLFYNVVQERFRCANLDEHQVSMMMKRHKKLFMGVELDAIRQDPVQCQIELKSDDKFMSLNGNTNRRLDFFLCKWSEIGSARIHYTGPTDYNRWLRLRAIKMGFKLTQHGLFKNEELVESFDENKIFQLLNLKCIDPKIRSNSNRSDQEI